jgi:hypothetical protein
MTFDEWLTSYFGAMLPGVPAHLRHAYEEAYDAGREEGKKLLQCPGCGGQKVIQVRVQLRGLDSGRQCVEHEDVCPVCQGTGIATAHDVERFFAREFPEELRP